MDSFIKEDRDFYANLSNTPILKPSPRNMLNLKNVAKNQMSYEQLPRRNSNSIQQAYDPSPY